MNDSLKPLQTTYCYLRFLLAVFKDTRITSKLDYESIMIIATVATNYALAQFKKNKSLEIDKFWKIHKDDMKSGKNIIKEHNLTILKISKLLLIPKETTRRKVVNLCKKKILIYSTKNRLKLGQNFQKFAKPMEKNDMKNLHKLLKCLNKVGTIKPLIKLK